MTSSRAEFAGRAGFLLSRVSRAWRVLPPERRLAALAAVGLFLTLFLPWYQETIIATSAKASHLQSATETLTGWGAFSWVEAAVLVVSLGVLFLLFRRAEGHAFHLPGGDGWVVTVAGAWTCFLIIWRMFDKEGTTGHGQYASTAGIEWGIFIALLIAAILAYAGTRIRAARQPEPPLPDGVVFDGRWQEPGSAPAGDGVGRPAGPESRASRRRARTASAAAGVNRSAGAGVGRSAAAGVGRSAGAGVGRSAGAPAAPVGGSGSPGEDSPDSGGAPASDSPGPGAAADDPAPQRRRRRSSWSPAERPDWSEPNRPNGWLTAPPAHLQTPSGDETAAIGDREPPKDQKAPLPPGEHGPPSAAPGSDAGPDDDDQLTIPFDR